MSREWKETFGSSLFRGKGSHLCSSEESFFERELERRKKKRRLEKESGWNPESLNTLRYRRPSEFIDETGWR